VTVPPFLCSPVDPPPLLLDDDGLDDAAFPIGLSPPPHPAVSAPTATAATAMRVMPLIVFCLSLLESCSCECFRAEDGACCLDAQGERPDQRRLRREPCHRELRRKRDGRVEGATQAGFELVPGPDQPAADDDPGRVDRDGQVGQMQGQLVIDYWKAHPEADKNADGKIQYVMISGPADHQDAQIRTVESIKFINDNGVQTAALAEQQGDWNRPLAVEQMNAIYAQHGDAIEFVLANNDNMAIGAVEALKANGYFGDTGKFMPVVGVDATEPALESMRAGELLGTVLNDAVNQGTATFNLACVLASDGVPTAENTGYTIDGQYVWVPYVPVGSDDLQ